MVLTSQIKIGLAAIVLSLVLFFVGIPYAITAPSNISNIVLSPRFWPQILSGLMAFIGVALVVVGWFQAREFERQPPNPDDLPPGQEPEPLTLLGGHSGAAFRLVGMAVLMVAYIFAMPYVGMVWASMAAFIALAFLIKTHHPVAAAVSAIVIPLLLYAFFAHVAGVAIPQGEFVRLP